MNLKRQCKRDFSEDQNMGAPLTILPDFLGETAVSRLRIADLGLRIMGVSLFRGSWVISPVFGTILPAMAAKGLAFAR